MAVGLHLFDSNVRIASFDSSNERT